MKKLTVVIGKSGRFVLACAAPVVVIKKLDRKPFSQFKGRLYG